MNDLIKIYLFVFFRSSIFKLQLLIRFVLNGRCYPTKEQRESNNFKDFWIGWIAYKYFSKLSICNGWLSIDFVTPSNDFIFTTNSHGDKMTKTFYEVISDIKQARRYYDPKTNRL